MSRGVQALATLVGWTLQVVVLGALVLGLGAVWGWALMLLVGGLHGALGWPDGTLGYAASAVVCSAFAGMLVALVWKRGPEDRYARAQKVLEATASDDFDGEIQGRAG